MIFPRLRLLRITVQDKVFEIPHFNCPQITDFSFYSKSALLKADTVDNLARHFRRLTQLYVEFSGVTTKAGTYLSVERTLKLYSEQLTLVNLRDVNFEMFESGQLLRFPKLTNLHLDRSERRRPMMYDSDLKGNSEGVERSTALFQLKVNCPELKTLIVHTHGQEVEFNSVFPTCHLERVYIKAKASTNRNYSHPRGSLKHEIHTCSWLSEERMEFEFPINRSLWKNEIGDASGTRTAVDEKTGPCIQQ